MPQSSPKKTVFVTFANHFDLTWRRCWERAYEYDGARYASYSDVETAIMDEALALAEAGRGAYQVEQVLTIRMYLQRRPDALPRLRRLHQRGLFEVFGAGESIIDVNMCRFETMARNMASGTRFCGDVLGMPPVLATHCDGFGSSAQFPQVIRGCGYRAVEALSYSVPDNDYWRGLDGSTVYVWKSWPGRNLFYDHCYHEPCLVCRGHGVAGGCPDCKGTGFDLPQNFYPPFLPLPAGDFKDGVAHYAVTSEEMLPPAYMDDVIRQWNTGQSDIQYQWGTHRNLTALLAAGMALADAPPTDRIASRVENNAAQTGCYVTRVRAKQGAVRSEAIYYSTEAAVAAALFANPPAPRMADAWHELFLELPLFYFHDAVTGTHQDDAARELLERMATHETRVADLGCAIVAGHSRSATAKDAAPDRVWRVFNPRAEDDAPLRIPLPVKDWRQAGTLVAETQDGRRFPVTLPWHRFSPAVPLRENRLINAVGSGTRARPAAGEAFIEASALAPLAWTSLTLREALAPRPASTRELMNSRFRVHLGEHGIEEIADLRTGARILGEPHFPIGALRLDEDEGDPWNSRKLDPFKRALAPFTRLLGAAKFDGYSEAWYGGIYEPNLPFGRELDPMMFALEWFVTMRLLDGSDRMDFHYEIFWKTANRRVRMVFPTQAASDIGWYSIPGGWLQRERHDQKDTVLWSPNGDWPAQNMVAAQGAKGSDKGWAVIHYGTPAARIEDGRILISPLRSPAFGHCLERYAQRYPMPTSGIRDPGWHHFTLSLLPHAGEIDMPRLVRTANALNARPMAVSPLTTDSLPDASWPRLTGPSVELAACKPVFLPAPAGTPANAVVLRLLNLSDSHAEAKLTAHPATGVRFQECNLLEQPVGPAGALSAGASIPVRFTPFQVRSFLVWKEDELS
jgi:alpha-mannosidase